MVHTFWRVLIWGKNEKYGEKKKRKKGSFSGWLWPDWANTARAAIAGLGFKCLKMNVSCWRGVMVMGEVLGGGEV